MRHLGIAVGKENLSILGIIGAIVGGFIGAQLGFGDISGFDIRSMLLAVGGGVLVLFLFGLFARARA